MKTSYWGRSGNAAIDTVLIDPSPQLRDQEREADAAKRSEGDLESVCAKPKSLSEDKRDRIDKTRRRMLKQLPASCSPAKKDSGSARKEKQQIRENVLPPESP